MGADNYRQKGRPQMTICNPGEELRAKGTVYWAQQQLIRKLYSSVDLFINIVARQEPLFVKPATHPARACSASKIRCAKALSVWL